MRCNSNRRWLVAVFSSYVFLAIGPKSGFSQSSFYEGKAITIVHASEAGDAGDMRVKSVLSVLKKYIPGNPILSIQYMPGGGGRKAGNYIYKTARADGLTIGAMSTGFVAAGILGEQGVLYETDKIIYLGSLAAYAPYVFMSRKGAGLNSLEKLRSAETIRIGSQSIGHINYTGARIFALLLDMRQAKFVPGYSAVEIDAGLTRGELDARINPVDTILRRNPEWVEKDLMDFHAIIEVPKGRKHPHPRFTKLPDLANFARSDIERDVVGLHRGFRMLGQTMILPPGTPRERVQVLQEAMRMTFKDPQFAKEYEKFAGEESLTLMPEEVERSIRDLAKNAKAKELFKKLAGPEALPPR
jgi:tripartite-type tricarboxylate transporter receptor subunit TctC